MDEKLQIYPRNPNPSSSLPSLHRDSHIISKVKPKIRIIHIFAPEIIKTDAANFRELVQRLTGKPSDQDKKRSRMMKNKKKMGVDICATSADRVKVEEEIWRDANSVGGFLGGFADFDHGFMLELNDQFPLLDGDTSQMLQP